MSGSEWITKTILDTRGKIYCENICFWFDGTIVPATGHNGNCKWVYDGQVFYHKKYLGENM